MKSKIFTVLSTILLVSAMNVLPAQACDADAEAKETKGASAGKPQLTLVEGAGAPQSANVQKATFQVKGMMCKSCEKKIQASLTGLKGVKTVSFQPKNADGVRLAEVTYDTNSNVTPALLVKAVQDAGYQASKAN